MSKKNNNAAQEMIKMLRQANKAYDPSLIEKRHERQKLARRAMRPIYQLAKYLETMPLSGHQTRFELRVTENTVYLSIKEETPVLGQVTREEEYFSITKKRFSRFGSTIETHYTDPDETLAAMVGWVADKAPEHAGTLANYLENKGLPDTSDAKVAIKELSKLDEALLQARKNKNKRPKL